MPDLNKILVPVDFSACSRAALDYAAFLGGRFTASIDVLHVWQPPHVVGGAEMLVYAEGQPQRTLAEFARTHAGKEMEEFLATIENRGLKVRGRLETGDPYVTILRVAADEKYDLIVMGTHGRTGLQHLLMGSVAEKVVRRSSCPVLTIRIPEQAVAAKEGA
ncbi:MAG TPA: universal stress protein [Polyangia bacterium]|nr:universal stress protein [Polyangia bacterium]